jgi:hypothetical protein
VLGHQVHLAAKQFGQVQPQTGVFQLAVFSIGLKLHQQVNVAVRLHSPRAVDPNTEN